MPHKADTLGVTDGVGLDRKCRSWHSRGAQKTNWPEDSTEICRSKI